MYYNSNQSYNTYRIKKCQKKIKKNNLRRWIKKMSNTKTTDFVKITIDYTEPIGNLTAFYNKYGIIEMMQDAVIRAGYYYVGDYILKRVEEDGKQYRTICLPTHIHANHSTDKKICQLIKDTWEYYSVDRYSGEFKQKNKVYKKHSKRNFLTKSDNSRLSFHFLNLSPTIDDQVPDNELWIDVDVSDIEKIGE